METDLQYYTRLALDEMRAARRAADNDLRRAHERRAASNDLRRAHERRASAFTLRMHRLESTPASISPLTRLQPLALAA